MDFCDSSAYISKERTLAKTYTLLLTTHWNLTISKRSHWNLIVS